MAPGQAWLAYCGFPACPCTSSVLVIHSVSAVHRGVAAVSGLVVQRQDAADQNEGGSVPNPAAAGKNQQHQLLLWPQCGLCEHQQLQVALEVAQPQQQTELQLVVLPSTMPAELLMTHQGEVCTHLQSLGVG
eukprot:GHRQ01015201.1.p2 GENE.GHRQ01015201.1~~GHRQ01015201.1.p2  ORF type:complete len:132 (+),score=55.37 GHRQ01015201.1:681-1076(+)